MAHNSNNFAAGTSFPEALGAQEAFTVHLGRHWILFVRPLVKLALVLVVLHVWVFFFPSAFDFARLFVIGALLVTGFSLFVTCVESQCNRFVISPAGFQIRRGLTHVSVSNLPFANIESVEVSQTLPGRFFDYGNVEIRSNGGSCKTLTYVDNPNAFQAPLNAR